MSVMNAPAPQHMLALAKANEIRRGKAALGRKLKNLDEAHGLLTLAEWVADRNRFVDRMTISQALMYVHRMGRTRVRRIISTTLFFYDLRVGENKFIGDLTDRQRAAFYRALVDLSVKAEGR